ncbi:UbiA prenyltransferase family protein [Nakamurella lactea]|uniref:hypothetical protein n=1 Tax=Nakamurella lactea TaxID=459515 RepID=UPI0003F65AB6|nr:hypothetical protein [Nakamurella lactea]
MMANASQEPTDPLPTGHWWTEQEPAPLPQPSVVPPEPELTLGEVWRAHQRRRALLSPFPHVASDPYPARLAFAVAVLAAGVFAWFVGMKAAVDGSPWWLAVLLAPMTIGVVLLLLSRRVEGDTLRPALRYTGRGLLWSSLIVGLISFGGWSFLRAAL